MNNTTGLIEYQRGETTHVTDANLHVEGDRLIAVELAKGGEYTINEERKLVSAKEGSSYVLGILTCALDARGALVG